MSTPAHLPTLLVTEAPVSIALPPAAPGPPGASRLVAALASSPGGPATGIWDFRLDASAASGCLILSPASLDQGFLILDVPGSPPVAAHHRGGPLPAATDELELTLERSGPGGTVTRRYRLKWADPEVARRHLAAWSRAEVPPVDWFYVELTSYCNLSCPFCPSKDLKRPRIWMSPELARRIFGQIGLYLRGRDRTLGYARMDRLVFLHVMGEPLLHPRFEECVGIAREEGLTPALFTNATLLHPKNVDKVLRSGIEHVTLSLNTVDAEGYRGLGTRDRIEDQERRVLHLLRRRAEAGLYGLHVDIQYVASAGRLVAGRGLLESKEQFWDLYRRWLLLLRHLSGAAPAGHDPRPVLDPVALANPLGRAGGDPSLRFPLDRGVHLVVKDGCSFGNAVLPAGHEVVPTDHGHCPFDNPFHQMAVFADGSVSFCNLDCEASVNLGSLRDLSVAEIWSGSRMRRIRAEMSRGHLTEPLCQRCLGTVARVPHDASTQESLQSGEPS